MDAPVTVNRREPWNKGKLSSTWKAAPVLDFSLIRFSG